VADTLPGRPGNALLATVTGVVVLAEAGLAAIGYSAWTSLDDAGVAARDVAALTVAGASAAVGALVALLILIALARGLRGHRLAQVAAVLAGLRAAGVVVALGAVGMVLGLDAVIGTNVWLASGLAAGDALAGLVLAAVGMRRTRNG
jgi:hypothetical protein